MSDALTDLVALAATPPEPLAWQDNPDHAAWRNQLAACEGAIQAAQQAREQALGERDDLQAQINEMEAHPEEPTIENRFGKIVTNPAYRPWKQALDGLKASRDAAQVRADAAQSDVDRGLAMHAALVTQEPLAQMQVPNPARAVWAQRVEVLRAQLGSSRWNHVFDGDGLILARWRAALAGQATSDQDVVEAFVELVARCDEAERVWHDFVDKARTAEDEAWRLKARVAELDRNIAQSDIDRAALAERWGHYQAALQAVADHQDNPPKVPGSDL